RSSDLRAIFGANITEIGNQTTDGLIIFSTEDEHLSGGEPFWNAIYNRAERTERVFDERRSATNCPSVGRTINALIVSKRRLAKIGENWLHRNVRFRRQLPQLSKHGFAADNRGVGHFRDRFGDLHLKRA